MLGLVGQKLAHVAPGYGIALTAACAITAQTVRVPVALYAGSRANVIGRKPLLGAAFLALALRGVFCALLDQPAWYVLVQVLDGIGAGLTGALIPVVIADLTRGSGHFALAQAGIGTLQGIGGAVSSTLAGLIVSNAGYGPAFLSLTAIAGAGFVVFAAVMPETARLEPGKAAARA
jgi:MFS family permease